MEAIRLSLESDTSPPHSVQTKEEVDVYDRRMIEAAKSQSLQEMVREKSNLLTLRNSITFISCFRTW